MLSSLDVLVLLKIAEKKSSKWGQVQVASELSISQSSVHQALKHAEAVRLYNSKEKRLNLHAFEEMLIFGAKYFLTPIHGGVTRGLRTGWAAPPLSDLIASNDELPPVWPDPEGDIRGLSLEPLYPTAPRAARQSQAFYELLALVDSLRDGRTRESNLAAKELHRRLAEID